MPAFQFTYVRLLWQQKRRKQKTAKSVLRFYYFMREENEEEEGGDGAPQPGKLESVFRRFSMLVPRFAGGEIKYRRCEVRESSWSYPVVTESG